MDPMKIWYYTEFQRQLGERSSPEDFERLRRVVEVVSVKDVDRDDRSRPARARICCCDLLWPALLFVSHVSELGFDPCSVRVFGQSVPGISSYPLHL